MLILFMLFLVIAVAFILVIRRNRETVYLLFLCLSLVLYLFGIMLYIAKKGGINRDLQSFLFLTDGIKTLMQYYLITLDSLGTIINVGRVLFPTVMILIAMEFSMIKFIRKNLKLKALALIVPIMTFIAYYPKIFRDLSDRYDFFQKFMVQFSYSWILAYIIISIGLLVYEYRSFKFMFWKRYFLYITIFISSLAVIFSLYAKQDPSQVYFFYGDNYLYTGGIYYMYSALPVHTYIFIVGMNVTFAVFGLFSFFRYTRSRIENDREALLMQRDFDMASIGASAFVHSTKNQLLSNRIVYKRMKNMLNSDEVDLEQMGENLIALSDINEALLMRVDELHKSVRVKNIKLVPTSSRVLFEKTMALYKGKYPDSQVETSGEEIMIMMDVHSLSEVLYNILSNAEDAVRLKFKDQPGGKITMRAYQERLYSVIEIRDNGPGMMASEKKRIFEPFYSSKNSNYNWGMGLHYAREIVKGHYGTIRLDTIEGEGTTFYVLLPRY